MHRRFTIEEHVRWSDIDRAGIIYYGQFLRFFEIAETELFRSVGLSYSEVFDKFDIWLPRVQIHFDFRKPLVLDDLIEVSAWVGRFGGRSLRLNFEVNNKLDQSLVAEGHIVLACVSRSTFKSVAIPPEMLERLRPYLETGENVDRMDHGGHRGSP
jgi:YbgC/YbaW family acyl-CoA thioester hydrolase